MKSKKFFQIIATVACMMLATNAVFAQSRVTVYGNTNMVSRDNDSWALEVNGKVVTDYDYRHFQSTDGVWFAVEDKGGKWGICDNTGTFLFSCQFAKTSVSGSLAMLYTDANGEPKIYDCKMQTYVQAQRVDENFFENEYEARENKQSRDGTVKRAQELSASVPPERKFEIRNNESYTRQELFFNGKVRFECDEILGVETTAADTSKTGWWLFVVKDHGMIGACLIQVYEKEGELVSWVGQTIPYRYKVVSPMGMNPGVLECKEEISLFSGGEVYFDWVGFEMKKNGIAYERTGREWVCVDKATDKWELQ